MKRKYVWIVLKNVLRDTKSVYQFIEATYLIDYLGLPEKNFDPL